MTKFFIEASYRITPYNVPRPAFEMADSATIYYNPEIENITAGTQNGIYIGLFKKTNPSEITTLYWKDLRGNLINPNTEYAYENVVYYERGSSLKTPGFTTISDQKQVLIASEYFSEIKITCDDCPLGLCKLNNGIGIHRCVDCKRITSSINNIEKQARRINRGR